MIPFDAQKTSFKRIRFLQCFIGILFLILACAIFYRQGIQFYRFNKLGNQQCLRRILRPGIRGTIYDCKGRVLATHRNCYCLYVDLNGFRNSFAAFCKKNKDKATQQEQLWALVYDELLSYAKQIGSVPFQVSPQKLLQHYQQNLLLPLKISQDLPQDLYAELLNRLPYNSPFQVSVEYVRHYPYGSAACHVIGYVTQTTDLETAHLPGNDLRTFFLPSEQGQNGIEKQYDAYLSGRNGGEIWRVTPSGKKQEQILEIPSVNGQDLTLSLDIELQKVCENAMEGMKGSVSIVDIATGGVLAMVSRPGFNLNELTPVLPQQTFEEINARGAWLNRAIQGLYPPGSTFKVVGMSAGLRAHLFDSQTTYTCTGIYSIDSLRMRCHNRNGHGSIHPMEAITVSCNPFFIHYGLQLGVQGLRDESILYQLHQPTGIDLPWETKRACIPSPQWKREKLKDGWALGDTANMSIGQGYLLVTPFRMACFAAAVAQNRTVFQPHLACVPQPPYEVPQALLPDQWEFLKKGMTQIGARYISFLPTALKTGTAQVKVAHSNSYTHIGWMIGFAPADHPQIAFCIQIEQQGTGDEFWGGRTCAPIAKEFLSHCLQKGILQR